MYIAPCVVAAWGRPCAWGHLWSESCYLLHPCGSRCVPAALLAPPISVLHLPTSASAPHLPPGGPEPRRQLRLRRACRQALRQHRVSAAPNWARVHLRRSAGLE